MKFWPFSRREDRAQSYTDTLVNLIVSQATGDPTSAHTAGAEGAVGLWARAFASARPTVDRWATALNPAVMYQMGRDLCITGRWVAELRVGVDGLYIERADTYNVNGLGQPSTWDYELSFNRPSGQITRYPTGGRVLDVRLGVGLTYNSPLTGAATTTSLLQSVETRLGQEADTNVGYLLPLPVGRKTELAADLKGLKGRLALVESSSDGWEGGGAPHQDFAVKRIGANPPMSLMELRAAAERSIYAAAGAPLLASLSEGTALREGMRRFLHATISPVSDVALVELRTKLDDDTLGFDFSRLFASDLQGRARSFGSLVKGGMAMDQAAKISGVLADDD